MDPIVVTINRTGETKEFDLLVQPDVPVDQLSTFIAEGLNWNLDSQGRGRAYEVVVFPPGRVLGAQETLADAQVGNGARLIFHAISIETTVSVDSSNSHVTSSNENAQIHSDNPIVGHRKLRSPVKTDRPSIEPHDDSTGYVLKQIDKD